MRSRELRERSIALVRHSRELRQAQRHLLPWASRAPLRLQHRSLSPPSAPAPDTCVQEDLVSCRRSLHEIEGQLRDELAAVEIETARIDGLIRDVRSDFSGPRPPASVLAFRPGRS